MKRSMIIDAHICEPHKTWKNPTLTIKQYDNAEVCKQITITVSNPWELTQIEQACKAIRDYWKSVL